MIRLVRILVILAPAVAVYAAAQAAVHVDPAPAAPRPLEPQTEKAAVRDYLQSWQAMQSAFSQDRADLLDGNFTGTALDKLSGSIQEQSRLVMRTDYQDVSHDIHFLFYSPEGLSIEFTDLVKYNVQVFEQGWQIATRQESARYLVVMTPAEISWKVRIFQAMQE